MKKLFAAFLVMIYLLTGMLLYGDPDGRTGRTLKTSTQGCGGCHGGAATTGVSVVIGGPDTVNTGQTVQYSLTITRSTKTGAGLDIAVRNGSLSPVSNNIHLSNGELTHNFNIPMTSGTMSVNFNYSASSTQGIDTIWSTGLATNSNGGSSGDEWNWSVSKRVVVRLPSGISNNTEVESFGLHQNYPNPFNPVTKIRFDIPGAVGRSDYQNTKLVVYNDIGKEIATLLNAKLSSGEYEVVFDPAVYGSAISSGVYFYRLTYGKYSEIRRMVFLK
jgi:hypothetical protein